MSFARGTVVVEYRGIERGYNIRKRFSIKGGAEDQKRCAASSEDQQRKRWDSIGRGKASKKIQHHKRYSSEIDTAPEKAGEGPRIKREVGPHQGCSIHRKRWVPHRKMYNVEIETASQDIQHRKRYSTRRGAALKKSTLSLQVQNQTVQHRKN